MTRALVAAFLLAHGLLHAAIYATPKRSDAAVDAPFEPGHSWLLGAAHVPVHPARAASVALAWVGTATFTVSAILLLAGTELWASLAALAALVSMALKVVFFNPWLTFGVLLDVGVLVAVQAGWPPSLY